MLTLKASSLLALIATTVRLDRVLLKLSRPRERSTKHWAKESIYCGAEATVNLESMRCERESSVIHQPGRARQLICFLQFHLQPRKMSHRNRNYVWQGRTNHSNQNNSSSDNSWKNPATSTWLHLGMRGWEDAPGRTDSDSAQPHLLLVDKLVLRKQAGRAALRHSQSPVLMLSGSLLQSQGNWS